MKLFVSRKKYDLLNKEYLLLNDKHEELKDNYEAVNISNEINLNNIIFSYLPPYCYYLASKNSLK